MALLAGSVAIDAGNDTYCTADPVYGVDQRGVTRPQDGNNDTIAVCDIGAFELQPAPPCLFCDDFNAGSISSDWTIIKPNWTESGGALNAIPTRKAVIVAQPGFAGCVQCYAEASISIGGGTGNRVWFLSHYMDKNNMMQLLLKEENNKVVLKQVVAGRIVAKAGAPVSLVPNTAYIVRINYDGSQYQVLIDGVPVLSLTPVGTVPSGSVGFEAKNTTAAIDYVEVN
jgi:hypothetical protein